MRTAGILVAALLSVVATSAWADTFSVNSTADAVDAAPGDGTCATASGACTLRAAVQEANMHPGADVVTLPSGVYLLTLVGPTENLCTTGDLDVTEALDVNGAGAETTIIDGLRADRIFHVGFAFALRDVTVRHGIEPIGGAIYALGIGDMTIERTRFEDNLGGDGGAIAFAAGGLLTITGSTFEGNVTSGGDGGAVALGGLGSVTVTDSTFTANIASSGDGGALVFSGPGAASLTNTIFSGNSANNAGGALLSGPSLTATGCTFDGNSAVGAGGGLLVSGMAQVTVTNSTITNNRAEAFGGALLAGDIVNVAGGEVADNVAVSAFGGLYVAGANGASVAGTPIRRNNGGNGPGGGLYAAATSGNLAIANVEVAENSGSVGGGIFAQTGAGNLALNTVRVLNNGSGSGPGGGIFAATTGALTITDSIISGNIAAAPGGGIYASASGPISIQGSTLAQNHAAGVAAGLGGGATLTSGAASTITNTTMSGNVADMLGGALYMAGDVTIRNATFADNDAPAGSALYNAGGTFTVTSTIVTGAVTGHCAGPITSGGNNIDSDASCAFAGPGDLVVDPQLGPLGDHGGPTPTHLPAVGSPAVDGGAQTGCPATDQRGEARPTDGNGDGTPTCDIGAVEFLDLCPTDPAKVLPGICGCGVADTDETQANGTADCLINGELKARVARAKAIIGTLSGDQDPAETELGSIGASLPEYLKQFHGQVGMNGPEKKVAKLARKAAKMIKKVTKAKAGAKLDKAKTKANKTLDVFDAAIAPQA